MTTLPMTRMVTHRDRSTDAVVSAANTHSAAIAAAFETQLGEGAGAAVQLILGKAAGCLERARQNLRTAESAHATELADDDPIRKTRDESILAVRNQLGDIRTVLPAAATTSYMSAIGLYGSTPEDPSTVGRFALHVAGGLEREPLPPSRLAGYTFPAAESAARLRDGVKRIDASVALLANESKENAESKVKRDEAIQAFDEVFQRTANLTSVLLEVAALPELAAKVRPSPRRPGSTVAIEEEVRAAEGETPAPPVSAPG